MIKILREKLDDGVVCRIFTARAFPLMYIPVSYSPDWQPRTYEETIAKTAIEAIREWCKEHIGCYLEITCVKDYHMFELYDDRCVQVPTNSGKTLQQHMSNLIIENELLKRQIIKFKEAQNAKT